MPLPSRSQTEVGVAGRTTRRARLEAIDGWRSWRWWRNCWRSWRSQGTQRFGARRPGIKVLGAPGCATDRLVQVARLLVQPGAATLLGGIRLLHERIPRARTRRRRGELLPS